jgi:hypothetical protein
MARARKAPASGSSGRSGSSSSSSTGRSRSQTTRAKQATGRTASKAKTTTKKRTSSAQTASRQAATRSRSTSARATARTRSSPTKEQLVERVSSYARRLKRDELSSLVDRLESGTLRLGDLAVSGEGGDGFQDDVRTSVPDRARRAAKGR